MSIDFATRRLCPDGACIGVIGSDGRCKECGRRSVEGDAPGAPEPEAAADEDPDPGDDDELLAAPESDADPAFDEDRELCPDDACIGLIGSDGRCKVCGRARGS